MLSLIPISNCETVYEGAHSCNVVCDGECGVVTSGSVRQIPWTMMFRYLHSFEIQVLRIQVGILPKWERYAGARVYEVCPIELFVFVLVIRILDNRDARNAYEDTWEAGDLCYGNNLVAPHKEGSQCIQNAVTAEQTIFVVCFDVEVLRIAVIRKDSLPVIV
jgi:hypothetical protein